MRPPHQANQEQLTKIWEARRPLAPAVGTVGFRFAQVRSPVLILALPQALA